MSSVVIASQNLYKCEYGLLILIDGNLQTFIEVLHKSKVFSKFKEK